MRKGAKENIIQKTNKTYYIYATGITICVLFVSGSHSRRVAIFCNYYTLARRSGFLARRRRHRVTRTTLMRIHIIMVYRYAIIKCTL